MGIKTFISAVLPIRKSSARSRKVSSLVYLLFCVTKYGWGWDNYNKEVNTGKGLKMHDWMRGYLTCVLPVIVLFIFAFGIYDKFFA